MAKAMSIKEMLLDPSSHWKQPQDILTDTRLNSRQRLEILQAWERDARALSVAADESMGGGEETRLSPVVKARIMAEELAGGAEAGKGNHGKFGGR